MNENIFTQSIFDTAKTKQNIFKQFKQKKSLYSKAQLVICCITETVMK